MEALQGVGTWKLLVAGRIVLHKDPCSPTSARGQLNWAAPATCSPTWAPGDHLFPIIFGELTGHMDEPHDLTAAGRVEAGSQSAAQAHPPHGTGRSRAGGSAVRLCSPDRLKQSSFPGFLHLASHRPGRPTAGLAWPQAWLGRPCGHLRPLGPCPGSLTGETEGRSGQGAGCPNGAFAQCSRERSFLFHETGEGMPARLGHMAVNFQWGNEGSSVVRGLSFPAGLRATDSQQPPPSALYHLAVTLHGPESNFAPVGALHKFLVVG